MLTATNRGPQTIVAQQTHLEKYQQNGEGFSGSQRRVARGLADDQQHETKLIDIFECQRFMAAGRVQSAIGSSRAVTAFNCFVAGDMEDTFVHGTQSIMHRAMEAATTMRAGGGLGTNYGTLRPRNAPVRGILGKSSGPVTFMHVQDAVGRATSSHGNRRGAQMGVLPVWHPDIEEFIDAKKPPASAAPIEEQVEHWRSRVRVLQKALREHKSGVANLNGNLRGIESELAMSEGEFWKWMNALQATFELTGFNISVGITDEFMMCLDTGEPFKLRWGGQVYREVNAAELWEKIMRSTWDWAEPGVLFLDTMNRENNLWYAETLSATNPCFTGDTKVWTAQGHRSFRELASSGQDVQVLTQTEDGRLVYRWMRKPRLTQEQAQLVKVTFDDGSSVRCTPEHKFFLRDGRVVEARWLKKKDSICSVYRHKANSKGYKKLSNGLTSPMEHHVPFEDVEGLGSSRHVHHKNGIKGDNRPENLELIDASEHNSMHMRGDSNPLRRFPDRNPMKLDPDCTRGAKNGRYRADISDADISRLRKKGMSLKKIAEELGCCKYTVGKRLKELSNHKVVSVEILESVEDVYCGTVDETHRFFIALDDNDGVLVSNCGEQPLPPHGACLLGSFNLTKYMYRRSDRSWALDLMQLAAEIPDVVRAMDNVVDRTIYPLAEQAQEARAKRRMGLGVTGLANALEALGLPYGSHSFLSMEESILSQIAHGCYSTGIDLAREKGAFPMLDAEKYLQSGHNRRVLTDEHREGIRRWGIRNSHYTSIAPTGTISLSADNPSSSIEPVWSYSQERLINFMEGKKSVKLYDYGVANFGVLGKKADNVTADEHLSVLLAAQKWVDSAVSKTCNVSGDMPWEDFKNLYRKAWAGGAKGCTTFNKDGKRAGILKDTDENLGELTCTVDANGRRSCE